VLSRGRGAAHNAGHRDIVRTSLILNSHNPVLAIRIVRVHFCQQTHLHQFVRKQPRPPRLDLRLSAIPSAPPRVLLVGY